MAADPIFCTVPNNLSTILPAVAETSLITVAQSTLIWTPGANGSLLLEIDAEAVAATLAPVTVAALIYIFLVTGGVFSLFDTITVAAVTASTTVAPWRATPKNYGVGLPIKTGTTLVASQSLAPTTGQFKLHVFGMDA